MLKGRFQKSGIAGIGGPSGNRRATEPGQQNLASVVRARMNLV